jgi:UDP-galactose transporter B1
MLQELKGIDPVYESKRLMERLAVIALDTQRAIQHLLLQLPLISKNLKKKNDDYLEGSYDVSFPKEIKLIFYVLSLYIIFITWGYLQEKITSTNYISHQGDKLRWDFPVALNILITISAGTTGHIFEQVFGSHAHPAPFLVFWKVALASALASPIGYFSLKFVSFPMMILSKSSKHVPVMFIGKFWYNKKYELYRYVSVGMICGGIFLFSLGKSPAAATKAAQNPTDDPSLFSLFIGLALILLNLSLDGITSNEQDQVFHQYSVSSFQMMRNTNLWQSFYLGGYLLLELIFRGSNSQLIQSITMLTSSWWLLFDVLTFCFCACLGQVLLFRVIREFGSLVWITVSVTRQLFTVLFSVFLFNHNIQVLQWIGILSVFSGLGLDLVGGYLNSSKQLKQEIKSEDKFQDVHRDIENLESNSFPKAKNE